MALTVRQTGLGGLSPPRTEMRRRPAGNLSSHLPPSALPHSRQAGMKLQGQTPWKLRQTYWGQAGMTMDYSHINHRRLERAGTATNGKLDCDMVRHCRRTTSFSSAIGNTCAAATSAAGIIEQERQHLALLRGVSWDVPSDGRRRLLYGLTSQYMPGLRLTHGSGATRHPSPFCRYPTQTVKHAILGNCASSCGRQCSMQRTGTSVKQHFVVTPVRLLWRSAQAPRGRDRHADFDILARQNKTVTVPDYAFTATVTSLGMTRISPPSPHYRRCLPYISFRVETAPGVPANRRAVWRRCRYIWQTAPPLRLQALGSPLVVFGV